MQCHAVDELPRGGHRLAVEGDHDVIPLQAGPARGRVFGEATQQRPLAGLHPQRPTERRRHVLEEGAQGATRHPALPLQLGQQLQHDGGRHGEADASRHRYGGGDAHHLPAQVEQGAAGVSRVDGRVCLQEVVVRAAEMSGERADDAQRDAGGQAKGVPHRQHPVPGAQPARVAEPGHREAFRRIAQSQEGEVRGAVAAHQLSLIGAAIGQVHQEAGGVPEEVEAGEDQATPAKEDARAGALARGAPVRHRWVSLRKGRRGGLRVAFVLLVGGQRPLAGVHLDADHRGQQALDQGGQRRHLHRHRRARGPPWRGGGRTRLAGRLRIGLTRRALPAGRQDHQKRCAQTAEGWPHEGHTYQRHSELPAPRTAKRHAQGGRQWQTPEQPERFPSGTANSAGKLDTPPGFPDSPGAPPTWTPTPSDTASRRSGRRPGAGRCGGLAEVP